MVNTSQKLVKAIAPEAPTLVLPGHPALSSSIPIWRETAQKRARWHGITRIAWHLQLQFFTS